MGLGLEHSGLSTVVALSWLLDVLQDF